MRRFAAIFLTLTLLLSPAAGAVNSDRSFEYFLTVNDGGSAVAVAVGSTVTVTVTLTRTDSDEGYAMFAMQDNLLFNNEYFALVEDSIDFAASVPAGQLRYSLIEITSGAWSGWSEIVMSMYTMNPSGLEWPNSKEVISFELEALKIGGTEIVSRSYTVTTNAGEKYECTSNNVAVSIKDPKDLLPSAPGGPGGIGEDGEDGEDEEPADPDDGADVAASEVFSDVPADAWFHEAVSFTLSLGLFQGTAENTFSPNVTMTRAMFVTVLSRLAGVTPDNTKTGGFTDVPGEQWYSGAVDWAVTHGIVSGKGDGVFDPDGEITREQMALILYNYAKYAGESTSAANSAALDKFPDSGKTSDWAKDALVWAASIGIIAGSDGELKPSDNASRAQVAQIIFNYCALI